MSSTYLHVLIFIVYPNQHTYCTILYQNIYCTILLPHLVLLYNLSRILLYTLIGKLTVQFSRIVIVQSYLYNLSRIFIVQSYTSTLTVQSFQLVYIVHFYICTFIVHSCRYIYNTVYHLNYCTTLDVNPSIMRLRPRPFCNFNHLHISTYNQPYTMDD